VARGWCQAGGQVKEAVFSSSEARIRTSGASVHLARQAIFLPKPASWTRRAAQSLFSVLFPSDCRICGAPLLNVSRLPVCPDCLAGMHPITGKICSLCGERVPPAYADQNADGLLLCPVCRRIDRPFDRAVAYGSYEGGLRELIHLLKYNGVRPAASVLGRMLADAIADLEPTFGQGRVLVIPVPLHRAKRRERGFNQAELIAGAALRHGAGRFELATGILERTRATHSQIDLTSHQRRENLRGAFAVPGAGEVTGREVLLVDDVYTTGTTVAECARVLRRAGAAQVWVATVARTMKEPSFKVSGLQSFKVGAESAEPEKLEASA